MTFNQSYEVPMQSFGTVLSHDFYTAEQLQRFEMIEAFGKNTVAQTVELSDESDVETLESID